MTTQPDLFDQTSAHGPGQRQTDIEALIAERAPDHKEAYPWPTNAAHSVPEMIALQYLPTPRAKKWRTAYRMHIAGRANMTKDAPEIAAQEGWASWRITTETL